MAKASWYDSRLAAVNLTKVYEAQVGFVAKDSKDKPFYGLYSDQMDFNENEIFMHSEALKDPRYRDIELPDSLELRIRVQPVLTGDEGELFLQNEQSKPDPATRDKRATNWEKGWRLNVVNVMIPSQSKAILDQMVGQTPVAATPVATATTSATAVPATPVVVAPQQPAAMEPEANRPQLARFEVHATPVGNANSDEWEIALEAETEDGQPVPGLPVSFKYGSGANSIIRENTSEDGCVERTIHVPTDVTARAKVNSVYSIPNIPLGGPNGGDPTIQLSGWDRWSNPIWVTATLLLVLTFGMKAYHSYRWITLPYEQKQIIQPQSDIPTTIPGRESTFPTSVNSPPVTSSKTNPADSIWWGFQGWGSALFWNWLPTGSWFMWLLYLILWVPLTIACFADDIKRAYVKVHSKIEHGLDSWGHKRKAFSYAVVTVRDGNQRKVQYYFNNKLLGDQPNLVTNFQEAWSKMSWAKIFFTSLQGDLVWEVLRGIARNLFRR